MPNCHQIKIYATTTYLYPDQPPTLVVDVYQVTAPDLNVALLALFRHHRTKVKQRDFTLTFTHPLLQSDTGVAFSPS